MRIIQLVKPALFIYECLRILILTAVLLLNESGNNFLGQLVYTAPSALFPLMALFLCLNQERYGAYLPLYAAGKFVCITTLLAFSIISRQVTMIGKFIGAETFLIFGDILSIAVVLLVYKDNKKNIEIKADVNTEERLLPRGGNFD